MPIPIEIIHLCNSMPTPINGGARPSLKSLMTVAVLAIREQWPEAVLINKENQEITDDEAVVLGSLSVRKHRSSEMMFCITSVNEPDEDENESENENKASDGMPLCICQKSKDDKGFTDCDCVFNGNERCCHGEEFELCLDVNCEIVRAIEYACES